MSRPLRALLAVAVLALACRATPALEPTPGAPPSVAVLPETSIQAAHGLRLVERWVGGATQGDPSVPVIVAVHGLGDDPENFAWSFEGFDRPARIVLPAGPTPFGQGYAWMTIRTAEGRDEALARQIDAAAARVAALCRDLGSHGKKPILTGFSQGGMVSWAVAARHPEVISGAFPIGGYLAPLLAPGPGQPVAPIQAFHGEADAIVPLSLDQRSVELVGASGVTPQLRTYPDRAHVIAPEMRRDLFRAIGAAIDGE